MAAVMGIASKQNGQDTASLAGILGICERTGASRSAGLHEVLFGGFKADYRVATQGYERIIRSGVRTEKRGHKQG
jgi:hypothetical protein